MLEENFLFRKVREIPQTQVVTCDPSQDIHSVAVLMTEGRASGAVVCDRRVPVGIITDRDFRDLFAKRADGDRGLRAEEVMRTPLVMIDLDNYVFEALFLMTRNSIHHLVIVDAKGEFAGVVSDADLMNVHTATPLYFKHEINGCRSFEELRDANAKLIRIIGFAMDAGARTRDMVRLISMFNDAITKRLIALLKELKGVYLPEEAAFLALGSEGRKEQTLRTDQDNALLLAEGMSGDEVREAERFARELVDALHFIGVPYCPGGVMASNPRWRESEAGWLARLDTWMTRTTPEALVEFGAFQDFRHLHGNRVPVERLRRRFNEKVAANSIFHSRVARNVMRFPPALGFFDRVLVEKKGDHKDALDLKKAGIFAIVEGVSLLAAETGRTEGTTWEKIGRLAEAGLLSREAADEIELGYTFLMWLRLKTQVAEALKGGQPTDYAFPSALTAIEEARLHGSLHAVKHILKILRDRYHTDLLR